jgi:alpha-galactosidase
LVAKLELSRELSVPPDVAWQRASDLSTLGDWLVLHQGWRCDLPDELAV